MKDGEIGDDGEIVNDNSGGASLFRQKHPRNQDSDLVGLRDLKEAMHVVTDHSQSDRHGAGMIAGRDMRN